MSEISKKAPQLYALAKFISDSSLYEPDKQTLIQIGKVAADTYATAFSGIRTSAFESSIKSFELLFSNGNFRVWGRKEETSLSGAIFYNSLAISSTDFDEGHRKAVGHPASNVVAIALELGRYLKKTKKEIFKSILIGYEVACRFSLSRNTKKISTYSSGRWGALGSAATAAYLLELDADATAQALSNASILSPAMLGGSTDVSTGSMSKEGVAWAVQSGFQSAIMAKDGFSGPYLFVDDHDDYNSELLLTDLGKQWLINSNYFKPYACCRWLHSAVSAAELIRLKPDFKLNEIKKIVINTFSRAIDLIGGKYPDNTVKAQFHLPYVVSTMLLNAELGPLSFQNERLNDKEVLSLIDKTELISSDKYSSVFPASLPSSLEIEFMSGEIIKQEVLSAPWDFGDHPKKQELREKYEKQCSAFESLKWEYFFDDIQ